MIPIIKWICFSTAVKIDRKFSYDLINDEDIKMMKELDVTKINNIFEKRPPNIISVQRRVNKLKAIIHWEEVFHRTYIEPYIDGL